MTVTHETVELYNLKYQEYGLLFPDDEYLLLNTEFKDTGYRDTNQIIIANWWMNVYLPKEDIKQKIWRSWNNAIDKNFTYCKISGYNPETGQNIPQLSAKKGHETWPQVDELQRFITYSKYLTREFTVYGDKYTTVEKRPRIFVSIFENSLSEHGSYNLLIFHKKDIRLYCSSGYSSDLLKKFECLFDAINYVKENHYYG